MKPVMKDNLYCGLLLEGEGADSSKIESIAAEEGFRKQTERHVTILGSAAQAILKGIFNKFSNEERVETLEKVKSLLESLEWKYKQVSEKTYQEIYEHFTATDDTGGWPIDFTDIYYETAIEVLGFEPAARMYLEVKKRFPNLTLAANGNGGWELCGTVGTQYVYYDAREDKILINTYVEEWHSDMLNGHNYLGEL